MFAEEREKQGGANPAGSVLNVHQSKLGGIGRKWLPPGKYIGK